MKFRPIGRNFFDPQRKIQIPQHRVELWPGYFTSIMPNESGIMLIADVSHKIVRLDTVYDYLQSIRDIPNWKEEAKKELIGKIVITRYNNRTYRIDEIDWESNPQSTFTKKSGEKVSYAKYYSETYNLSLHHIQPPLLINFNRRRNESLYLIPEFCCMTGLTDDMRADFGVMRDLAEHTRVIPQKRGDELVHFMQDGINQSKEAKEELNLWGMRIDSNMLSVEGHVFNSEKIVFGRKSVDIDPRTSKKFIFFQFLSKPFISS